jgi:predicted dehydrogenase
MTEPGLRCAVVGVGHLGKHHARILAGLEGLTLVGVADTNEPRSREIASAFATHAYTDAAALLGKVDVVSIAVPTEAHADVAIPFLERGTAVLVEKPLARSVEEADRMLSVARRTGAVLAVGHTERFNPAVAAAWDYVREPRFIEVHRLGTFPERSLDIDVVFDLMIHDLDLVLAAVHSDLDSIEAVGVPVLTGRVDIANARLRFRSGCVANITASRISRDRVRKIRFFQQDAYVSIDCGSQEAERYCLVRTPGARPVIEGGKLDVVAGEPLKLELEDFVAAVRSGGRPRVSGEDGRRAVDLAQRITERIGQV